MMHSRKIATYLFIFLFVGFLTPKTAQAISLQEFIASRDYTIQKLQESVEYLFAFKVDKKVEVLEKHAEKRLDMAQDSAEKGDDEKVQNQLQNYLQIKEKQNNLLGETGVKNTLGKVENRTIEQQKQIEEIKTQVNGNMKREVRKVQEQVVNQVAERVINADGKEGATEFLQKVEHVWAPGTSEGGENGADIHTVEVKSAGGR